MESLDFGVVFEGSKHTQRRDGSGSGSGGAGQGVAWALSDSDANDTKEDACAPAARKSTKQASGSEGTNSPAT